MNDRLKAAALEALRACEANLRTEIERQTRELNRDLERVMNSIRALSGDSLPNADIASPPPSAPEPISGEFIDIGPQPAVEKVLNQFPNQVFTLSEMVDYLTSRGFSVRNPKLLRQQVLISLLRAAKNKRVANEVTKDGKRAFRWTEPKPETGSSIKQ